MKADLFLFHDEISNKDYLVYAALKIPTELFYVRISTFSKIFSEKKSFEEKLHQILDNFIKDNMIHAYQIEKKLHKITFASDGSVFGTWED